jgi:hypothetical protein
VSPDDDVVKADDEQQRAHHRGVEHQDVGLPRGSRGGGSRAARTRSRPAARRGSEDARWARGITHNPVALPAAEQCRTGARGGRGGEGGHLHTLDLPDHDEADDTADLSRGGDAYHPLDML